MPMEAIVESHEGIIVVWYEAEVLRRRRVQRSERGVGRI